MNGTLTGSDSVLGLLLTLLQVWPWAWHALLARARRACTHAPPLTCMARAYTARMARTHAQVLLPALAHALAGTGYP